MTHFVQLYFYNKIKVGKAVCVPVGLIRLILCYNVKKIDKIRKEITDVKTE